MGCKICNHIKKLQDRLIFYPINKAVNLVGKHIIEVIPYEGISTELEVVVDRT